MAQFVETFETAPLATGAPPGWTGAWSHIPGSWRVQASPGPFGDKVLRHHSGQASGLDALLWTDVGEHQHAKFLARLRIPAVTVGTPNTFHAALLLQAAESPAQRGHLIGVRRTGSNTLKLWSEVYQSGSLVWTGLDEDFGYTRDRWLWILAETWTHPSFGDRLRISYRRETDADWWGPYITGGVTYFPSGYVGLLRSNHSGAVYFDYVSAATGTDAVVLPQPNTELPFNPSLVQVDSGVLIAEPFDGPTGEIGAPWTAAPGNSNVRITNGQQYHTATQAGRSMAPLPGGGRDEVLLSWRAARSVHNHIMEAGVSDSTFAERYYHNLTTNGSFPQVDLWRVAGGVFSQLVASTSPSVRLADSVERNTHLLVQPAFQHFSNQDFLQANDLVHQLRDWTHVSLRNTGNNSSGFGYQDEFYACKSPRLTVRGLPTGWKIQTVTPQGAVTTWPSLFGVATAYHTIEDLPWTWLYVLNENDQEMAGFPNVLPGGVYEVVFEEAEPPFAAFTVTKSGLTADVDASSSTDPDNAIVSYSWNWGDGSLPGSGITASHTYAGPGIYVITLTVEDETGIQDTASERVWFAGAGCSYSTTFDEFGTGANLEEQGFTRSGNYGLDFYPPGTPRVTVQTRSAATCGKTARRPASDQDTADILHRTECGFFSRDQVAQVSGLIDSLADTDFGVRLRLHDEAWGYQLSNGFGTAWYRVGIRGTRMIGSDSSTASTVPRLIIGHRRTTPASGWLVKQLLLPAASPGSRWYVEGAAIGNTIYARAWPAGTPKPTGWQLTYEDTSEDLLIGAPGFYGAGTVAVDLDSFAVGTEDVPIPTIVECNPTIPPGQPIGALGRILVENADRNGFEDLTALLAKNWVLDVDWGESVDEPGADANVTAWLETGPTKSLSPLLEASLLNRRADGSYAPLLDAGRAIRIQIEDNGYHLVFDGVQERVRMTGWRIQLFTLDGMGRLKRRFIETEDSYPEAPLADTLQALLNKWKPGEVLYTPSGTNAQPLVGSELPLWVLPAFIQGRVPLADALRGKAQQIGWDVRYLPHPDGGINPFRLTLFQPPRDKNVPDETFGGNEVGEVKNLEFSRLSVRNRVRVRYRTPTGIVGSAFRVDPDSVDRFEEGYIEIGTDTTTNIDSYDEAEALANAILNDLSEPPADQARDMPLRWWVRIFDLIEFLPNYRHFDRAQLQGVSKVRHRISHSDREGRRTQIESGGRIIGQHASWLTKDRRDEVTETGGSSGGGDTGGGGGGGGDGGGTDTGSGTTSLSASVTLIRGSCATEEWLTHRVNISLTNPPAGHTLRIQRAIQQGTPTPGPYSTVSGASSLPTSTTQFDDVITGKVDDKNGGVATRYFYRVELLDGSSNVVATAGADVISYVKQCVL